MLEILTWPDDRLRLKARPVDDFGGKLHSIIKDMFEAMYKAGGVGLAATQVNIQLRLLVMDIRPKNHYQPIVLINPKIVRRGNTAYRQEGCLSFPDEYAYVHRASEITVETMSKEGKTQTIDVSGIGAACIQHEIDHLDGRLFVDYLSRQGRRLIERNLRKRGFS